MTTYTTISIQDAGHDIEALHAHLSTDPSFSHIDTGIIDGEITICLTDDNVAGVLSLLETFSLTTRTPINERLAELAAMMDGRTPEQIYNFLRADPDRMAKAITAILLILRGRHD